MGSGNADISTVSVPASALDMFSTAALVGDGSSVFPYQAVVVSSMLGITTVTMGTEAETEVPKSGGWHKYNCALLPTCP